MCQTGKVLALTVAWICIAAEARADFILAAQSVLSAPPPVSGFPFERTIDQSGLSAGYVSGVTDFSTYVGGSPIHTRNNAPANFAATSSLVPQNVDYDLGTNYTVQRLAFWNYPFNSPGAVTGFEIHTSEVADFSSSFFAGAYVPANDGNDDINHVQVFDLPDSFARYVRVRVTGMTGSSGFGFSEIAFGAAVVPEPSSLASIGALGIAATMRRRKSVD